MFPQGVTPPGMTYFLADASNAICYKLNSLKTEALLNNITELISYLTGNILRLRYKNQELKAVKETIVA
jgi:hypothetical protein